MCIGLCLGFSLTVSVCLFPSLGGRSWFRVCEVFIVSVSEISLCLVFVPFGGLCFMLLFVRVYKGRFLNLGSD